MKILHVDSRRKEYQKEFGSADLATIPDNSTFGVGVPNTVEAIGGINCTAMSTVKAATSQTKVVYDPDDLFSNTPHSNTGAYPPDTFGAMVKRGLKRFGTAIYDTIWKSYWVAHTGPHDPFNNTVSAMFKAQSSSTAWTYFYNNWLHSNPGQVLPQGDTVISEHDWLVKDWKTVNGIKMFVVDFHTGFDFLMPAEVFNREVTRQGCGTGIPATTAIQSIASRDFFTWVSDVLANMTLQLKRLLIQVQQLPQTPMPQPQLSTNPEPIVNKTYSLDAFCIAIRDFEGQPGDLNYQNNNPGNCRCSKVGYRDIYGAVKCVNNFAVFPTYTQGMLYLHNLIKEKIQEHPQWTVYEYFALFHAPSVDHNDPAHYAATVAKQVGCSITTPISTFI